ncbi:MAG: hypothetical protein MRY64_11150 [Hyphomonadaceae bacterium]|nr:hypothetical protein [Hyphomonadaceae bacterium]
MTFEKGQQYCHCNAGVCQAVTYVARGALNGRHIVRGVRTRRKFACRTADLHDLSHCPHDIGDPLNEGQRVAISTIPFESYADLEWTGTITRISARGKIAVDLDHVAGRVWVQVPFVRSLT